MPASACWRGRRTPRAPTWQPPPRPCASTSTRPRVARRPPPPCCSRCRGNCAPWSCRASTRRWRCWPPPRRGSRRGATREIPRGDAPGSAPMKAALWLLALFGVAVAIALFAGNNQGTVTLFWPPYRLDLSLNLVLLLLFLAFAFVHAALGALAALFDLPRQALRWRAQQKERAMHAFLMDSISHLLAGRFIRARKSAELSLAQERSLGAGEHKLANAPQIRALAHLLAAEGAQALQDRTAREEHLQQALAQAPAR